MVYINNHDLKLARVQTWEKQRRHEEFLICEHPTGVDRSKNWVAA